MNLKLIVQKEIHFVSYYQRGTWYIFSTPDKSIIWELNSMDRTGLILHGFPLLCMKCDILHVTPNEKAHLRQIEIIKHNGK